jgi:uncharacterized protein
MTSAPTEEGLAFDCSGETLIGILHRPTIEAADSGVLIVVGGPQYRAGSHRQFTLLARALAVAGYPVLRFDYRGMGDSSGAQRSFEEVSDDIGAAITAGQQRLPYLHRWLLWGLCDGASAALLYWHTTRDTRVRGLCLVNPWVRTQEGLASTHVKHYYLQRALQRDFWQKVFRGRVARHAVRDLVRNLRLAGASKRAEREQSDNGSADSARSFQSRMAQAWALFDGPILLLLSGDDLTAQEFVEHARRPEWRSAMSRPNLTRIDLAGANHTFSSSNDRYRAETSTLDWLARCTTAVASAV